MWVKVVARDEILWICALISCKYVGRDPVDMWVCGYVGMWVCGYVGMWVSRDETLWVCAYVGMWVLKRTAVGLHPNAEST
jgi:hypothetical protein